MSKIRMFLGFVGLCGVLLSTSGCFEEASPYLVENTIDLQSPNGIYEGLLFGAAKEAFDKHDWAQYKDKKIFCDVTHITDGYLDHVVSALVMSRFVDAGALILTVNKSGKNADKTDAELKSAVPYDFDVSISAPVSGVYYYEGFLKRNYYAYVMASILSKKKDGTEDRFSSGIVKKKLDRFIPSKVFVVSVWVLLVSMAVLLFAKLLFLKNMRRK